MSQTGQHDVTIQRRGRSHRACCGCGWRSTLWNELRPAEADAWHHVYGDDPIVDLPVVVDLRRADPPPPVVVTRSRVDEPAPAAGLDPAEPEGRRDRQVEPEGRRDRQVERLVRESQALADGPSPYSRSAIRELKRLADRDAQLIEAAISEVGVLLTDHSRNNAHTADSEWLRLITAKRLLAASLRSD